MEEAIRKFPTRAWRCRFLAAHFACLLILAGAPAFAVTEATRWGPFDFPSPVRTQSEAQSMYDEAKEPIVIAIRFLALADTDQAPWINHHLACGTSAPVRKDLVLAMVRASTLMAHRLADDLDQARASAAELRAGHTTHHTVRYAGPVAVVLEPVRISAAGEAVSPPAIIEPHLRVFVSATVPRCAADATGAYGHAGELAGGFMITAAPALELGWPTYSAGALNQRVVMATENLLADGFCCGQEFAFGLESLANIYEYRDYQTKNRLRGTLRALGNARQRDPVWSHRVREAFGLPDRFPENYVRELQYGSGRIAAGELTIWPSRPEAFVDEDMTAAASARTPNIADFLLAFARYAHIRADLVSPAILESYDPERKYSFVGWPEEFRPPSETADADQAPSKRGNPVLEVFGTERKYSFVGQPEVIQDNIAFAFAAWKAEIDFAEQHSTKPFLARYAPGSALRQASEVIAQSEAEAVKRRQPAYHPLFPKVSGDISNFAAYAAALRTLDRKFELPGYATLSNGTSAAQTPGGTNCSLRWGDRMADVPAGSVEELRSALVGLYRDTYRGQLADLALDSP